MTTLVVELQALNLDRPAVTARVGLPVRWNHGRVFSVDTPPGWTGRNLATYLIQQLGPVIYRIDDAPAPAPLGGCNCLGRR